jgi:tripartite-type tricarboxylate transporter receptor subunit TctC
MKFLASLLLFVSFNLIAAPIEFVLRGSPGAPDDILVRKMLVQVEKDTNLKFVLVTKPGAAHIIAYNYFESRTTPTLILADKNMLNHTAINSSEKIFNVGDSTNILFVKNGSNIKTFDDLVNLSKEREIIFGLGGVGSGSYEAANSICQKVLRCLLVPYKSSGPGMIDVASGVIDAFAVASYGGTSYVDNSMYQAILMFSTRKNPTLDVPLLPKKYQDLEIRSWLAIYARNLSTEDRDTIQQSLNKMKPDFFIENGLYK